MSKEIRRDTFHFNRFAKPALVGSGVDGPWVKTDTSVGGSPTVQAAGGYMELALDAANEAQNLCLYFGDVLSYDIDDLIRLEIWAKLTASLGAAVTAILGLGSARNDTPDSVAAHAWFRLDGDNNLKCESDDGVNDVDDIATGMTLSTTERKLVIDFKEGINSVAGGLSTGGKSALIFSAENSRGLLRRVARNQRFNAENYAGGLQPYFQLQKTAAATVATLSIKRVDVLYRDP